MDAHSLEPSTFGAPFGTARRDSSIAATPRLNGQKTWTQPHRLPANAALRHLLVTDELVVAVGATQIGALSLQGSGGWTRIRMHATPVAATRGVVFQISRERELEALGSAGQVLGKAMPVPGLPHGGLEVSQLAPGSTDFVFTAYDADPKQDEEDRANPQAAAFSLTRRTRYGEKIGAWGERINGEQRLAPLFLAANSRWLYATDRIMRGDVRREPAAFSYAPLPLPQVQDWCASAQARLYITGTQDGRATMVGLNEDGTTAWRWATSEADERWSPHQPPVWAQQSEDRVLALSSRRLVSIAGGKLEWSWSAPGGAAIGRVTSTQDGQAFVTSGSIVRQLSRDGKVVLEVDVGAPILTPAVLDRSGALYVATETSIVRID
jgi:hypothetical protein